MKLLWMSYTNNLAIPLKLADEKGIQLRVWSAAPKYRKGVFKFEDGYANASAWADRILMDLAKERPIDKLSIENNGDYLKIDYNTFFSGNMGPTSRRYKGRIIKPKDALVFTEDMLLDEVFLEGCVSTYLEMLQEPKPLGLDWLIGVVAWLQDGEKRIKIDVEDDKHIWWRGVTRIDGFLYSSCVSGDLCVVTASGRTLREAQKRVYRTLGRLKETIPDLIYRDDIGYNLDKEVTNV